MHALSYARVNAHDYRGVVDNLVAAHHAETEPFPDLFPLAVDWEMLERATGAGLCFTLAAFDEEAVVGYSLNFLGTQYRSEVRTATNVGIYLLPEHRHGRNGLRLVERTEAEAAECGARVVTWNVRPGTPFERLLQRRGYQCAGLAYLKEV